MVCLVTSSASLKSEVGMGARKCYHVVCYMRADVAEQTYFLQHSRSVGGLVRKASFCIHIEQIVTLLDEMRLRFR